MPTPDLIQGVNLPVYDDSAKIPDDLATIWYAMIARGVPRFSTTAQRDAAYPAPADGQLAWVAADTAVYVRAGGAWRVLWRQGDGEWREYTPALAGVTLGTGAVLSGRWCRIGNLVRAQVRVTLGTGGTVTGQIEVGTPVPASTASPFSSGIAVLGGAFGNPGGVRSLGQVYANTAATVRLGSTSWWGSGVPGAWAAGNHLAAEFTYEPA